MSHALPDSPPAERLAALRGLLAEKFPAPAIASGGLWETGLPALDAQAGGLRRGVLTEVSGAGGSGALFLDALLHATRRQRCFAALIDGARAFDPQSHDAATLARMLWVQCDSAEQAVKAADLLLRDGNLPLLILDLQAVPLRESRRIPVATWHRFQRLVEQTATAFVVLTPQPMVEGAKVRIATPDRWPLRALRERRRALLERLDLRVFVRGQSFATGPEEHRRIA